MFEDFVNFVNFENLKFWKISNFEKKKKIWMFENLKVSKINIF